MERKIAEMLGCVVYERNGRFEVEFDVNRGFCFVKAFEGYFQAIAGIRAHRRLNPLKLRGAECAQVTFEGGSDA